MLTTNNKKTLTGGNRTKKNKEISMAASKHIGKRTPKKSYLDMGTLIRSIQRAEGNIDCFQMGAIDCDQVECKWRDLCLEVYPSFSKKKS